MPLAFIAVLLDPATGLTHSVPVLSDSPEEALTMVQQQFAGLQARGLFDLDTLTLWRRQLDALPGEGPRSMALVVQDGRSTAVPLRASSQDDAAAQALALHPGAELNGIFPDTVLGTFIDSVNQLLAGRAALPA